MVGHPLWGVRLQASGYALNGFSAAQGLYLGDPTGTSALYGTDDPGAASCPSAPTAATATTSATSRSTPTGT